MQNQYDMNSQTNNEKYDSSQKVKRPISVQLIAFVSVLVIIALGAITSLVTYFVSSDTRVTAENNNFTVNQRTANVTENKFDSVKSNVYLLLDMVATESSSSDLSQEELSKGGSSAGFFFDRSEDIAFVCVPGFLNMKNEPFLKENVIDSSLLDSFISEKNSLIKSLSSSKTVIQNATNYFKKPLLAMFSTVSINDEEMPLVIIFSTQNLNDTYGTGMLNSSYLVDLNGNVLLHSDMETLKGNANYSSELIVQDLVKSPTENKQSLYEESDGTKYFGAFVKLSEYGCAVVTKIPYETVFNAVKMTMWRNIYISFAVLAIVILFIWFWSKSVSTPIKQLAKSAIEIGKGNYNQDFSEIKANKKRRTWHFEKQFRTDESGVKRTGTFERCVQ